jgi:NAD(P)-dependent dehydrogenase (short-subunit alcohol dehydrogenase family)
VTDPRTVLVTGANGGIGLAITLELARAGFDVVGTVRTDEAAADVRSAAADEGLEVRTAHLDLAEDGAGVALVERERPWAVVNNAGFAAAGSVLDVDDDEARQQLEVLVLGPTRLARTAARRMRDTGGGRIVNISSIAAEVSSPLLGWYQAAKAALEGISDAMRLELRRDGVEVVLVQPGTIRTGIWDRARDDLGPASSVGHTADRWATLTRRLEPFMSSPEAVARTVRTALTTSRPRHRYPVGLDAQVLSRVTRFVPVAVTDAATRALLHLR